MQSVTRAPKLSGNKAEGLGQIDDHHAAQLNKFTWAAIKSSPVVGGVTFRADALPMLFPASSIAHTGCTLLLLLLMFHFSPLLDSLYFFIFLLVLFSVFISRFSFLYSILFFFFSPLEYGTAGQ